jgi:hypothetical protein
MCTRTHKRAKGGPALAERWWYVALEQRNATRLVLLLDDEHGLPVLVEPRLPHNDIANWSSA